MRQAARKAEPPHLFIHETRFHCFITVSATDHMRAGATPPLPLYIEHTGDICPLPAMPLPLPHYQAETLPLSRGSIYQHACLFTVITPPSPPPSLPHTHRAGWDLFAQQADACLPPAIHIFPLPHLRMQRRAMENSRMKRVPSFFFVYRLVVLER